MHPVRLASLILCACLFACIAAAAGPEREIGPPRGPAQGTAEPGHGNVGRIGAVHDERVRYQLPFRSKIPRFCSQAFGGPTHHGVHYYAWDFVLPEGTPVLAARPGVVVQVIDRFEGRAKTKVDPKQNIVTIEHEDGTTAVYAHLQRGIPVEVGQPVALGETIAYSGSTGTDVFHLHFEVTKRSKAGRRSHRVRFADGSRTYVPVSSQWYPDRFRTRVPVRILYDGKPVTEKRKLAFAFGSVSQFRAERRVGGLWEDVTDDPRTEWASLTPWSVRVENPGQSRVDILPGFEEYDIGILMAFYGEPEDPDAGATQVFFDLVPTSP
ncbi:MAG: M23 family metallopeptidase [Myxococcales bacterium]|nr:M23 family metallopeptidase [Myxococcales bacterium]